MNNYTKIISNMEEKIKNFSKKISEGIDKKKKRDFIFEMLYGVIASNSCLLSEIARSLKEEITLKALIKRLSRNLNEFNNDSEEGNSTYEDVRNILINFYNGIKNIKNYAEETAYYYEGTLECEKAIGYINLYNTKSQGTLLEKIQISFTIPWSQDLNLTNFFILALTPNSIPIIKRGIISTKPLSNTSSYINDLKISKFELEQIQKNNAWILGNKNYAYFFFN